jgi:predicted glutamine amidotransferase
LFSFFFFFSSSIKQSVACKERLQSEVNGDGFGVGFYDETNEKPCGTFVQDSFFFPLFFFLSWSLVFVGTTPAWNNANLHRLADHVSSELLFAHVRAATPGLPTNEANCHPFTFGRCMFMHNGEIPAYLRFKRKVLMQLSEELFAALTGHTDSEMCFMVFLSELADHLNPSPRQLEEAMLRTIRRIQTLADATGEGHCVLNLVVSDGKQFSLLSLPSFCLG